MLALTSLPALDVFIGLAFFYFLLSIVASSINEGIATVFALRARTLETSIGNLLGQKDLAATFYNDVRVRSLSQPRRWRGDRKPSYIPSRVFALALLDTVAPAVPKTGGDQRRPPDEKTHAPKRGLVTAAVDEAGAASGYDLLAKAETFAKTIDNDQIRTMLQDALTEADKARDKADAFRKALERQFDEAMERVSGWYKRRAQLFLFAIALVLVGTTNADSFTIGQRLWKDDVLRSAVVAQAQETVKNGQATCAKATTGNPAETAGECIDQVKQLNIPLGWSKKSTPSSWEEDFAKFGGLLLTVFALLLGAPFWFDTLSKLAQLRGTGRASPDPSTPEGATTTKTPTPA